MQFIIFFLVKLFAWLIAASLTSGNRARVCISIRQMSVCVSVYACVIKDRNSNAIATITFPRSNDVMNTSRWRERCTRSTRCQSTRLLCAHSFAFAGCKNTRAHVTRLCVCVLWICEHRYVRIGNNSVIASHAALQCALYILGALPLRSLPKRGNRYGDVVESSLTCAYVRCVSVRLLVCMYVCICKRAPSK